LAASSFGWRGFFLAERNFVFSVDTENGGNDMNRHPVFIEGKPKAPAEPKSDTPQQSPAQEGVGEGSKSKKTSDLPPAQAGWSEAHATDKQILLDRG
jgi:hypothetical protein